MVESGGGAVGGFADLDVVAVEELGRLHHDNGRGEAGNDAVPRRQPPTATT